MKNHQTSMKSGAFRGGRSRLAMGAAAALAMAMASSSALADKTIAEFDGTKISIFGIIDVGLLYQSKDGANGKSKFSMETSGLRQTVLGFKGERDMGDGITAFFNLESHFDTNNGQLHGSGDAAGASVPQWRRQANVGIKGDWGSLTFGRQYGPALLAHIGTEPRAFKEQFSNLYAWAYNQYAATAGAVGTERNTNNDVGIFFSNAIQYRNTVGPVNFGVLWAVGGQEGSMDNNSAVAAGATYTGPVTLSASYQIIKDQGTGNNNVKHWGLGAAKGFGDFTFKINYLRAKNETRTGMNVSDVSGLGVGADWHWAERQTATVAYYHNKDHENTNDETRNVVLSNDFAWRPDTTVYVQAAFVDAGDAATIKTSIVAAGIPAVGKKTWLLNTGINFNF
ncbi:porin [Nitrogeniibacter mangrovi]|uniref:Porin n=1 Tax=Nitrogeniibacter mangrovi TaxID=2016596 RepID=A0A6C1B0N4_9RHOO|nr:porin [Nitrogeniibacter mangrovi]QID16933.1 porin [Nitrogeniibacter mangrovi]